MEMRPHRKDRPNRKENARAQRNHPQIFARRSLPDSSLIFATLRIKLVLW
jgi:hypothetical protein